MAAFFPWIDSVKTKNDLLKNQGALEATREYLMKRASYEEELFQLQHQIEEAKFQKRSREDCYNADFARKHAEIEALTREIKLAEDHVAAVKASYAEVMREKDERIAALARQVETLTGLLGEALKKPWPEAGKVEVISK